MLRHREPLGRQCEGFRRRSEGLHRLPCLAGYRSRRFKVYVEQLGAVPFKNCPASDNKFVNDGNALLADGKTPISWAFNYTPNVDAWRAIVVTALTAYSAGSGDWSEVEKAFVDGWAYEYTVVNG